MKAIETIMRTAPVIPVLMVEDISAAIPIARALVKGGLKVLEVTLRTASALDVIAAMKTIEGAIVGAGTVLNPDQLHAAQSAGAEFIVSPGLTDRLGRAAIEADIPLLPGVSSAGDIMRGLDLGLTHFKFFPAEAMGGIKALKALSGPFAQCHFCPTGGIVQDSAAQWLALESVLCVGGSWMVPAGTPDEPTIEARAQAAHRLALSL